MGRKWLKNYHGSVTPVYDCDHCDLHMRKVDKPDNLLGIDEINTKPIRCKGCGAEGFTYHGSWKEFLRYRELQRLEKNGFIKKLKRQVRMPIKINGILVFTYVADFDYYTDRGEHVIEDAKSGVETEMWKLKRKAVAAYYGVLVKIS